MASGTGMSNGRLAAVVVLVFAGFLALSFAMVPFYRTFCELTGLNGTTTTARAAPARIDAARLVTVEFTSTVMPGLAWQFAPEVTRLRLHPGEVRTVFYAATNVQDHPVTGQAVMSVTPELAATHFRKISCFCFQGQTLAPHQTRRMGVMFYVTPDIPADVKTLTLSYAVFATGTAKG